MLCNFHTGHQLYQKVPLIDSLGYNKGNDIWNEKVYVSW